MNFEDFRKDIESKLNQISEFELQEYHFLPYSFGNGIAAYRIKGQIHKFIFNGRENELVWLRGGLHQKYYEARFSKFRKIDGLIISMDHLKEGIS